MTVTECDLFTSTRPLHTFQPLVVDPSSFTTISVCLAVLNLALGLYCILANSCVLAVYRGKTDVVSLLYSFIASNDILTGITALLHVLVLLLLLSLTCPTQHLYHLSLLTSFLTMWTLRISVFYNLVLHVTRTLNIAYPFYHVNRGVLRGFLLGVPWVPWFPIIVHQLTIQHQDDDYMGFKRRIISSSSLVGEDIVHAVFGEEHYSALFLCLIVPFFFPALISLLSLAVQLWCLLNSPSPDPLKRRAAVTVLLLTLAFCLCSSTTVACWLTVCLNALDLEKRFLVPGNAVWVYITGVTIPFLNSAIAPSLLIWRGRGMRESVAELWRKASRASTVTTNSAL